MTNGRQRGFAMLMVMALAAVAMLGATRLLGDGAVAERRAQEEELLSLRAYWAMQGHVAYIVSRSIQGPPCGGTCINVALRTQYLDNIADELVGGGQRVWSYPEISPGYVFPVAAAASNRNPLVRVELTFPAAATAHPLIAAAWPIRRPYIADICAGVESVGTTCSSTTIIPDSSVTYVARTEPQ